MIFQLIMGALQLMMYLSLQIFDEKKWYLINMFGFVKQILISAITFFSCNALKSIACSEIVNVNSDEPVFYPYSVKINKCSGSCNNINYLYAKKCFSDVV